MKLVYSTLAMFAAAPLLCAATLVNVDFNSTPTVLGTFTGSGPLGGGTWNGVLVPRSGSAGVSLPTTAPLLDSTGVATSVTVGATTFNNSIDAGAQANVDDSMDPLIGDTLYLYGTQSSSTITLSGLGVATQWNLVLIAADSRNEGSTFTIGGTAKTTSDTGGIGATLVEGDEYVRFDNITSDGSGNISIAWTKPGTFACINGFQLQQVPEPSAALLGGLGLLGLLRRRR